MVRVFVPASARSGRSSALLRDSEIMAVCVPGAERPRTLRRVRPAVTDSSRSIIAASARLLPPPLPIARTAQAA